MTRRAGWAEPVAPRTRRYSLRNRFHAKGPGMNGVIGGLKNGKRPIAQNGQKGFTRKGSNVTGAKRKGLKSPSPKKKNARGPGKKNGFAKKKGDPKKKGGPKKNEVLKK